ncbi:MAG: c-type cytochrome, partial [Bacteroidia bacterium]|nr:c-type cytochrome [Bacteroidia bacterium]
MMKKNKLINLLFALTLTVLLLESCGRAQGDDTGKEFMPGMYHSTAYEANIYNYYSYNTWDDESVLKLKELSQPREPVPGTVARGHIGYATGSMAKTDALLSGTYNANAISTPANGSVPYYYGDSDDERARAIADIIDNPFPITEEALTTGKELYDVFCGTCHGEKGDGNGYLVREDGGVYPAAPANFLTTFADTSNGVYYHSIIHGKNVMGGYADKLSYEERWNVIHYIRSLQASDQGLVYSPEENTLNNVEVPFANYVKTDDFKLPHRDLPEIFKSSAHGDHDSGSHDSDEHVEASNS